MSKRPKFSFGLPPKEAIEYLREKKGYKLTFDYDEMMHEAHHRTFTVAKVMRQDLLADIHASLIQAQKDGIGFRQWKKDIRPTLQKYGWWGETEVFNEETGEIKKIYVGSRRLRTIFETNARVAYNVGRYKHMRALEDEVWWIYKSALLPSSRDEHKAKHNMAKHRDDPWWLTNYPPNAWHCLCKVIAVTKAALDKMGIKPSKITETIASKDWAYDVGSGALNNLEEHLYQKAHAAVENCDDTGTIPSSLKTGCRFARAMVGAALESLGSIDRSRKFTEFVDAIEADVKAPINQAVAGSMSARVYWYLLRKGKAPKSHLIHLTKHGLTHMLRRPKKALSWDEIRLFPEAIKKPEAVLWDKAHENVLYVFSTDPDRKNKIVVEVNYDVHHQGKENAIVTSGKVKPEDLNEGSYEVIEGRL